MLKSHRNTHPRRSDPAAGRLRRAARVALLATVGAAGLWSAPVLGQETPVASAPAAPSGEMGELLVEVSRRFRVVPLSDRLLLEPVVELDGILVVEVLADGFAIDGRTVSADELEARLGDDAGAVLALSEVDPASVREALGARSPSVPVAPPVADVGEVPAPPAPPTPRPVPADRTDAQVIVGSDVTIEAGEEVLEVVVFGGDLRVEGRVRQNAVALGGEVWVEGEVMGDAASVGSDIHLGPRAVVHGDTVSVGGRAHIADGAETHGDVVEVPFMLGMGFDWWRPGRWTGHDRHGRDFGPWLASPIRSGLDRSVEIAWNLVQLVILALVACLAFLIFRSPVERIGRKAGSEPWKAALAGLLSQILILPLLVFVVIILAISIIGIPLLLLVPFAIIALVVVAFLGYVAAAARLGDWIGERFDWRIASPYLVLLVGLGALHLWSFLGEVLDLGPGPIRFFAVMFMIFGALLQYVAWTIGFGAALLTRFGTAESWERPVAAEEAAPEGYDELPPEPEAPDWSEVGCWDDEAAPAAGEDGPGPDGESDRE